ncbi:DUF1993 domain-containing protein [Sphingosinicellaceae bacterium]|nr:DUF1993 domain-containing protein [Sphingosinicellaceae bacterium]
MTISMHQVLLPVLLRQFGTLSAVLTKAEAHAKASGIDPATLIEAKLAPDMLPLVAQIRIASDSAKGGVARLAGIVPPSYADDEVTFADLHARIDKTVAFIKSVPADQIDGTEERHIELKAGPRTFEFSGQDFLLHFVLPNFLFHCTVAYAILRHSGVEIGKMDYLGAS